MGHLRARRRPWINFIRLSAAAFGPALLNLFPFCGDPPRSCFDLDTQVSQSVTRSSKRKGTTIANLRSSKKVVLACGYCQKSFSRKSALTVHLRSHTGEKPYSCDVCKRSFAQSGTLTKHLRVHQAEKPFGCEYCGRFFSRKNGLTTHVRTHTGEKPYKCSECSECFAEVTTLGNHLRVHSGERPYKCLVCERGFTQLSAVKRHVKTQHQARPSQYKRLQKGERINTVSSTASGGTIERSAFQIRSTLADGGGRNVEFSQSVPAQVDETQSVRSLEAEKKLVCTLCGKRYNVRGRLKNHLRNVHQLGSEATGNDTVKSASGCPFQSTLAEHGSQKRIAPPAGKRSVSSNVSMHGTREQDHSDIVVTSWDDSVIGASGRTLPNVVIENHPNRTIRSDSAEHDYQIRAGEGLSHSIDQHLDEGRKPSDRLPDIVTNALPLLENGEVFESLIGEVTNPSLDPRMSTGSANSEDAQSPVVLNRTSPGLSHLDGEHLDEESTPALFVEVLKLMEANKIFELLGVETPDAGANVRSASLEDAQLTVSLDIDQHRRQASQPTDN